MTRRIWPRSGGFGRTWTRSVRGDIFRLRTGRDRVGNEQQGTRYCVVVQSDAVLLSTVLVAPTSRSAGASRIRPVVEIGGTQTHVLVDQTSAVSTERLGPFAGRLGAQEMREIDDALRIALGLF